ncbi:putative 60s ribosomal protein l33 [Diplodia seriata]|uniref:Putative 60s ribosomal protein l33 n=1 Tax=Diplodia seriata TaxID=420778 RepID=A0A0G2EE42_9PEZI|nr:putative 60s ribosomal protein l33 [Diplodia seriata]
MSSSQPSRLYVKGKHVSYVRGKHTVRPNTSILKLEGVQTTEEAKYVDTPARPARQNRKCFYCGKKVAFVYRSNKDIRGSKIRAIWGTVTRPHGNSGAVRAQFRNNLPPKSLGASVRVMLYPSNV